MRKLIKLLSLLIILLFINITSSLCWLPNSYKKGGIEIGIASIYNSHPQNTFFVTSEEELNDALYNYQKNDYIYVMTDIIYNNNLIFNKPVKLVVEESDLRIMGDLVFCYDGECQFVLDTRTNGRIFCEENSDHAGGFYASSRRGSFLFLGKGSSKADEADLYVTKQYDWTTPKFNRSTSNIIIDGSLEMPSNFDNFNVCVYRRENGTLINESVTKASIAIYNNTNISILGNTIINNLLYINKGDCNKMKLINRGIINNIYLAHYDLSSFSGVEGVSIENYGSINGYIYINNTFKNFIGILGNTKIVNYNNLYGIYNIDDTVDIDSFSINDIENG